MHKALRQVLSCLFFFFATGFCYALLVSRMVAIKEHVKLDDEGVGTILFLVGAGAIAGFMTVNRLIDLLSSRRVLTMAALGFALLLILIPHLVGLSFFAAFLSFGFCFALGDVAMNVQALNLERALKKPFMLYMYASFSAGGISGSLAGAAFSAFEIGLAGNFTAAALPLLALTLLAALSLLPDEYKAAAASAQALRFKLPPFVIAAAVMALLGFALEGAVAEWGSLLMHEAKGAPESLAALVYGTYSAVTALSRLTSTALVKALGELRLLISGIVFGFLGMAGVIILSSPYAVLLCYALLGLALAPIGPIMLSRVGHRPDIESRKAVAFVSLFGYGGMLIIPPALGFLAQDFGLEAAMLLPLSFIALMLAIILSFRAEFAPAGAPAAPAQ